jgi:hypothetical protein
MATESVPSPLAPLGREEYIEQAHFFRSLAERLEVNVPAQEILASVREEVLATTKLPLAIDFLLGELRHEGVLGPAMSLLPHYFTPFQAFIVQESESERLRFDLRVGLEILRREAQYRANEPSHQGLFLYQFEVLCRNRLGYDRGLEAVGKDPAFAGTWREWIRKLRRQIGMVDFADVVYVHSEYYWQRQGGPNQKRDSPFSRDAQRSADPLHEPDPQATQPIASEDPPARPEDAIVLFGEREGRIALANRKKDPLYLFSSLNRQLGYPEVPRVKPADQEQALLPQLARRMEQLETRIKIMEEEQRGGLDLTKFYERPPGT